MPLLALVVGPGEQQLPPDPGHLVGLAHPAEEVEVGGRLPGPEAWAGSRARRAALHAVDAVARPELVLEVERDVLALVVLVADDVVWAGDDAAGAAGAQAGRDDLLVQLLPLRRPARRSGLRQRHARNLASGRGSPPRQCPATMTAMQLTYDDEAEAFRAEIRDWLADNLPAGWVEAAERGESLDLTPDERREFNDSWPAKLFAGGWICATWPIEYGGKGLSTLQGVVLAEEFARVKAPLRADFFGDTLVGPTILQWGSEEQKKEFLPKILSGEMRWCQGFSEPDSGSDLASLKTTAVLDGDEWVINGQKVWTTQGDDADYCFLLTRTDPDAPKHRGISYLLVPMRQPGVEVRRITQPDGTAEFCEVFFSDARCPADNVVGGVNDGWKVANSTLAFERGQSATTGYRRFDDEFGLLVDAAREHRLDGDPLIRQRLAAYYTQIQILRINGLRTLSAQLVGKRRS